MCSVYYLSLKNCIRSFCHESLNVGKRCGNGGPLSLLSKEMMALKKWNIAVPGRRGFYITRDFEKNPHATVYNADA